MLDDDLLIGEFQNTGPAYSYKNIREIFDYKIDYFAFISFLGVLIIGTTTSV